MNAGAMLPAIIIWNAITSCAQPEPIGIRKFSLRTRNGQNVFQGNFETSDHLSLNFAAIEQQFTFELTRISVFSPDALVRIIDNVREQKNVLIHIV